MRSLAGACELNVATLYHHFPSKADVFRAVIEERLRRAVPHGGPPIARWVAAERLRQPIGWLWREATQEEMVWRLLIGESLRASRSPGRRRSTSWPCSSRPRSARWSPRSPSSPTGHRRSPAIVGLMFALIVEHLALGPDEDRAQRRIDDLVQLLV